MGLNISLYLRRTTGGGKCYNLFWVKSKEAYKSIRSCLDLPLEGAALGGEALDKCEHAYIDRDRKHTKQVGAWVREM